MHTEEKFMTLAEKVISLHCSRLGISRAALRARRGRNLAKKFGDVNLSLHRQILALYLEERLPVSKKRMAPELGYKSHINVLYNIQKAKHAVFNKVEEYVREYEQLRSHADKITPELDFFQKRGGGFIFSNEDSHH